MANARTTRSTPEPTKDRSEVGYIADRLVEKVWQGDERRRGLAAQIAAIALAAIQDYTASRYMETADEFTGQQLVQRWLDRHTMLEEARASVALDHDPRAETISLEDVVPGHPAYCETCKGLCTDEDSPVEGLTVHGAARNEGGAYTRKPNRSVEQFLDKQVEGGATVEHHDGWRAEHCDE